jgi:hypothetical protein
MKVFVATAATQGERDSDYHWCIEGELVRIVEVCRRDRDDPDGGCGCGRGFGGLNSNRSTTTARVVELPLMLADYALALQSSQEQDGSPVCDDCAMTEAVDLAAQALVWPVESVLERRLDQLVVRSLGVDA